MKIKRKFYPDRNQPIKVYIGRYMDQCSDYIRN
jgi:hypothetical protein